MRPSLVPPPPLVPSADAHAQSEFVDGLIALGRCAAALGKTLACLEYMAGVLASRSSPVARHLAQVAAGGLEVDLGVLVHVEDLAPTLEQFARIAEQLVADVRELADRLRPS